MIHRHYETVWEHALTLGAGGYWQKNYGTGAILSADYRHTVRANDVFEASAGVETLYRPYDGRYEPDLRASIVLTFRFSGTALRTLCTIPYTIIHSSLYNTAQSTPLFI